MSVGYSHNNVFLAILLVIQDTLYFISKKLFHLFTWIAYCKNWAILHGVTHYLICCDKCGSCAAYSRGHQVPSWMQTTYPRRIEYDHQDWLEPGGWRLEPGGWRLEPVDWSLEPVQPGDWRLEPVQLVGSCAGSSSVELDETILAPAVLGLKHKW